MSPDNPPSSQQTLTVQEAIDLAVKHHNSGEFAQAERICKQILQQNPIQPQTLHLLGLNAHQKGNHEQAVDLIKKALTVDPNLAEAHNNLGNVFKDLERLEEALMCYQNAINIKDQFPEATENLERISRELGKSNFQFLLRDILSISPPPLAIMDIGAMQEGVDRYSALIRQNLGKVTGFEPITQSFEILQNRQGPYNYLPYFLGNGEMATFYVTRYPGCSSLFEPNNDLINLYSTLSTKGTNMGNFEILDTINVETIRLDDIREIEKPDYVKIDVQGAELVILENSINTLSDVLVIETEVEFVPIYKNQPLFADIQQFLIERGFMLHKLIDVGGRALRPIDIGIKSMSQILWADAIFVRDYTNLQLFEDVQLLKASLILNDVYKSYDVVLYLLTEYDKRNGTSFHRKYSDAISNHESLDRLYMNLKEQL